MNRLHAGTGYLIWVLGLCLACTTSLAWATIALAPLSLDQLTRHADLVVHGRVLEQGSFRLGEGIFTDIRVEVAEAFKGAAEGKAVTLRMYGGILDGKRTRTLGSACFAEQEEVVLFLVENGPGIYNLINLAEGKFSVSRKNSDRPVVTRDLQEIRFLDPVLPDDIPTTLTGLSDRVRLAVQRHEESR